MKKIITALLAFVISATAVCSLASCKNANAPETGWYVDRYIDEVAEGTSESGSETSDSEKLHKVGFYVGDGSKKIFEIWVNIEKIYEGTADFTVDVYTGELNKKTSSPTYPSFNRSVTKDDVKQAKSASNWVKLGFNDKWKDIAANKQIMITVQGKFDFNEIVFIGTDGKLLSVTLEKLNYYYLREDKNIVMNATSTTDVSELEKSPLKLIDEQEKFVLRESK